MTVNGKVVVLTDVPQGACPLCGSRVYKAEVLERIESLMKGERFIRGVLTRRRSFAPDASAPRPLVDRRA